MKRKMLRVLVIVLGAVDAIKLERSVGAAKSDGASGTTGGDGGSSILEGNNSVIPSEITGGDDGSSAPKDTNSVSPSVFTGSLETVSESRPTVQHLEAKLAQEEAELKALEEKLEALIVQAELAEQLGSDSDSESDDSDDWENVSTLWGTTTHQEAGGDIERECSSLWFFVQLLSLTWKQKTSRTEFHERTKRLRSMQMEWNRKTASSRVAFDASSLETVGQLTDFIDNWILIRQIWNKYRRHCKHFICRLKTEVRHAHLLARINMTGAENETSTSAFASLADRVLSELNLADRALNEVYRRHCYEVLDINLSSHHETELTPKMKQKIQAELDESLPVLKRFRAITVFLEESVDKMFRLQPHIVKKLLRQSSNVKHFFLDLCEEYRGGSEPYQVGTSDSGFARFRQLLPS